MTDEAEIVQTPTGRQPAGEGWFILNAGEMGWSTVQGGGTGIWNGFESPDARSELLGIGIHILYPGDRPGWYHAEQGQEGFLVLSGECLALVEGQERPMRQWDYLHCPPGTAHIIIGAGDGPCALLMVGTRGGAVTYLPDPVAMRHGAAFERESHSGAEVYAGRPPIVDAPSPWPLAGPDPA